MVTAKVMRLTSVARAARRRGAVPRHRPVLVAQRHVAVAGLVRRDEVRQHGAEPGVVVAGDVLVGALHHLPRVRVADVARLAVVVPWGCQRNPQRERWKAQIHSQVMISTKSGMTSRTCCHLSNQSDSLDEYQFLPHCGRSDHGLAGTKGNRRGSTYSCRSTG